MWKCGAIAVKLPKQNEPHHLGRTPVASGAQVGVHAPVLDQLGDGPAARMGSVPPAEARRSQAHRDENLGPVLNASYPETGRDQVTVQLFDDENQSTFDGVWPVSLVSTSSVCSSY
jgi:hypothetical protein